jgi:hypothetical protein
MTKDEAYQAMEAGHKIRHNYYSPGEYAYLKVVNSLDSKVSLVNLKMNRQQEIKLNLLSDIG